MVDYSSLPYGIDDTVPIDLERSHPKNLPGQPNKISPDGWAEIAERLACGEMVKDIAKEFNVAPTTIARGSKERSIQAAARGIGAKGIREPQLKKFAAEARSLIWRADTKIDEKHPQYFAWKDNIEVLKERHRITYGAALIQASKNVQILWPLFRKFNVERYDKFPTSHPTITRYREQGFSERKGVTVKNEQIEQDHKANLNWAIAAAGENQRTGNPPTSCPNDAAYFLYEQAISSPGTFLSRFTSMESKVDVGVSKDERTRDDQRSLDEINNMLSALDGDAD